MPATPREVTAATAWLDARPLDELLVTLATTAEAILSDDPVKVAAGKVARDAMANYLDDRQARRVPEGGIGIRARIGEPVPAGSLR